MEELLHKLKDFLSKYQFVDCFCNVFKFNFNGSVCATKGQLLELLEEAVGPTNSLKELNECQLLLFRLLTKKLKEQLPSTTKKTNLEKAAATEFLESIAVINKFQQQTNFLQSIDSLFGEFVNFEGILVSLRTENSIQFQLKAVFTQMIPNS